MSVSADQHPSRWRIERYCDSHGLPVERWEVHPEEGLMAHIAGRFRIVEDDEDRGLFAGDEGTLSICLVGTAAYMNERCCLWFVADDSDYESGQEVNTDDIESA